ncbi:MAG: molybdopterin molybdotransferase MoeA [Planctomycetota bacterium]
MVTGTISLDEAQALVRAVATELSEAHASSTERCALADSLGRILAAGYRSDGPWPSTDRSAMDGFAVATGGAGPRASEEFPVVGRSLAGQPFVGALEPGNAVRIMTGGVVPEGADTVVRVEDTSGFDDTSGSEERVSITADVEAGANIRPQGSEVEEGAVLLNPGDLVGPAEIGALAVLGQAEVEVVRRPVVRIVSTGDEVVDLTETPKPHQVRDSNSWSVQALAERSGATGERLGIANDVEEELEQMFSRGLEADVLVTIGGVSKGTHDLVHSTLEKLGVQTVFHGIAMKPGKPTYFGRRAREGRRDCLVFGLPGNPQSTYATFQMLVVEALSILNGAAPRAELQAHAAGVPWRSNWREQVVPARLRAQEDGRLVVELARLKPSGDPFGLLDGTVFARVPGEAAPEETKVLRVVGGEGPR